MPYTVRLSPAAEKEIRKLDPGVRKEVSLDLLQLEDDPRPFGVLKLSGREPLYRIRVGPGKRFRAIYSIHDEKLDVIVVRLADRKEAYRGL